MALIPQPLLPNWEQGGRIEVPLPERERDLGVSDCLALIPQPLLPVWEQGGRIEVPLPFWERDLGRGLKGNGTDLRLVGSAHPTVYRTFSDRNLLMSVPLG
ncbi:MAG: hypothetical protein F6K30_04480 [Cyanothece sp. SIO2G6]|nr:hypothetical protein [Cyanothece sp. SIO2G6]